MDTRRIVLALTAVAAGFIAAGGTALTASNSLPSSSVTRGYGSQTITGVTATAVTYTLNTAEDTITAVNLTLSGDTTERAIQIAFNDAAPATCSGTGSYNGTSATSYTCAVSQSVSTATKFAVIAE